MITIIDIETGPETPKNLGMMMPEFTAPANYTKQEAIDKSVAGQRETWIDRAPLCPLTARVLAIGIGAVSDSGKLESTQCWIGPEKSLLERFWSHPMWKGGSVIGFNVRPFDIPMLIKRAWHHGIRPPMILQRNKWLSDQIVDLRELWQLGDRQAPGKLDDLAKFFGIPGKKGSGHNFHELLKSDRDKAREYCENDVRITYAIWYAMDFA